MNLVNNINRLYKNLGFYEKYGVQLIISIIIIFIFLSWSFYYYLLDHKPYLKAHWSTERCNPLFMPFAGMVLDKPNQSYGDAVEKNFFSCVIDILIVIADVIMMPIYYSLFVIITLKNDIINIINDIRALLAGIRAEIAKIIEDIEQRTLSITIPVVNQTIIIKDMSQKFNGVFKTAIYFLFGVYFMLKSLIGSIIEITVLILVTALVPLIVLIALCFVPIVGAFAIYPAIAAFLIYIAIMIPLIMINLAMHEVLHVEQHHPKAPPKPP